MLNIADQIAQELKVTPQQVSAAIALLDDGATVPFIARYRKEATNGLNDGHLRELAQRLGYLRELNERRNVILTNIEQQGKLTSALKSEIEQAENKTRLEDLYLPFKPKRRTKGQIAKEAGLAPFAEKIFKDWQVQPESAAKDFLNNEAGFSDVEAVLDGVMAILMEQFGEDAALLDKLRRHLLKHAHITSTVVKSKQSEARKYSDYFEHNERYSSVPSHRALAMFRGRNEGFLRVSLDPEISKNDVTCEDIIMRHYGLSLSSQPAASYLTRTVSTAWKQKLSKHLYTELLGQLKDKAEQEAITVFASNLKDLLLTAPAGSKVTLGIDPGYRTGCKLAIVDQTGKLLHTATIFPHEPQNNWDKSVRTIVNLCRQHKVELIAVGNGTASRESDKLAGEAIKMLDDRKPVKVIVSEAGASVYSASEAGAQEFPELDVSIRGAVSIARRLQDPLAELVKIDPKAIGVGQYQHDVSQSQLSQSLEAVIEDCVNAVGVDANSASAALLTHVAGFNKTLAQNVVKYRDEHGRFNNRQELLNVARLGPKAYEQAAGFLRVNQGTDPLDQTGVHPETYPVVEKLLATLKKSIEDILVEPQLLTSVAVDALVDGQFGEITVKDVIDELAKPNRDPRPDFKTASFKEGIESMADLEVGMILEGVVSNVAKFGAFVDIGVHQDGLVHISSLTDKFVSDPRDVVKAGDIVKVKVLEVEPERKRISLTMRLDEQPAAKRKPTDERSANNKAQKPQKAYASNKGSEGKRKAPKQPANAAMGNAFADALAKLKK